MPLKTRLTPSRSHLRGPAIADLCRFLRAIRTMSPYDAPACTSETDAAFGAFPCNADTFSGGPLSRRTGGKLEISYVYFLPAVSQITHFSSSGLNSNRPLRS